MLWEKGASRGAAAEGKVIIIAFVQENLEDLKIREGVERLRFEGAIPPSGLDIYKYTTNNEREGRVLLTGERKPLAVVVCCGPVFLSLSVLRREEALLY